MLRRHESIELKKLIHAYAMAEMAVLATEPDSDERARAVHQASAALANLLAFVDEVS